MNIFGRAGISIHTFCACVHIVHVVALVFLFAPLAIDLFISVGIVWDVVVLDVLPDVVVRPISQREHHVCHVWQDPCLDACPGIAAEDRIRIASFVTHPDAIDRGHLQVELLGTVQDVERTNPRQVIDRVGDACRAGQRGGVDLVEILDLKLIVSLLEFAGVWVPRINDQPPVGNQLVVETILARLPRFAEEDDRVVQSHLAHHV